MAWTFNPFTGTLDYYAPVENVTPNGVVVLMQETEVEEVLSPGFDHHRFFTTPYLSTGRISFQGVDAYIERLASTNTLVFVANSGITAATLSSGLFRAGPTSLTPVIALGFEIGAQGNGVVKYQDRGGNVGAGGNLLVRGGNGSTAGAGDIGGNLQLNGGDAAGSGNNASGAVKLDGGAPTGTGKAGDVELALTRGIARTKVLMAETITAPFPMVQEAEVEETVVIPGPAGATGARGADGVTTFATTVFFLPPDDPDEVFPIPGQRGADGATGTPGTTGRDGTTLLLEPDPAEEPMMIPGRDGAAGAAGSAGVQGRDGITVFLEAEAPEDVMPIPGRDGAAGSNGVGTAGRDGVSIYLEPEAPEDPIVIPGARGADGAAGGSGSATTVEVNLGATATWRGKFTITDAAITAAKKLLCWQAPGPYTGKGTRADEAEMAPVNVIAVNPAAGSAEVYWQTPPMISPQLVPLDRQKAATLTGDPLPIPSVFMKRINKVRGNVKFSYMVLA